MLEEEKRLFEKVQERSKDRNLIRIVPIGEQLGLHPQRTRQFARTWKNSGLVDFTNPNQIWLTEEGKEFDPNDES